MVVVVVLIELVLRGVCVCSVQLSCPDVETSWSGGGGNRIGGWEDWLLLADWCLGLGACCFAD